MATHETRNARETGDGGPRPRGGARERMLAGIPATERRLRAGGVSTSLLEAGAGPPLVLLHGGIECGGAIWAPVVARLAESRRLLIPDLPGLGESDPLPRLDPSSFSDWLADLLRLTCDEPPALVAHSLGGSLAARFAAAHPDSLRGLVIYAAPGIGPYRMPIGLQITAIRFGLRPTERNAERFDRWAFHDFDRARAGDPEWFGAFAAYTRSRAGADHVKRTMGQLLKAGKRRVPDADLAGIASPTALLWARHDRFVPLALAEGAANRHGWPLRTIEAAGHVPHVERADAFLRELNAALDDHTPTQRRSQR